MKVLLVCEDLPYAAMGGLAKHVLLLAKALSKAGHSVDILGGNQCPIDVAGVEAEFGGGFYGDLSGHLSGWKERYLGMFIPIKRPLIARRLAKQIVRRAKEYDVVHYHGHFPNIGSYIPKGINFVQTMHDQGSECLTFTRFKNGKVCVTTVPSDCAKCINVSPNLIQKSISAWAVNYYRKEVRASFLRHKTIFVSRKLMENFSRVAGENGWGCVIHNFVDMEKIRGALSVSPLKSVGDDDSIEVFIAGMLYEPKGILPLLRNLVPILPVNMKIKIAGTGPDEAEIRKEFGGGVGVELLGWCDSNVALAHAAGSSIIVVPSLCEEACATVILEGLMLGKFVFALDAGGNPELRQYQVFENQYKLFPNLQSLVDYLVKFDPSYKNIKIRHADAGVDSILEKIINVYAS